MEDQIGYDLIIEESMRGVIYKVLKKVEKSGLKGDHHFVVSFLTNHFGVVISDKLRQRFPNEMTIILQHQFHSLNIGENAFKISLSFSGTPENLTIPYRAITAFSDPSVNFALKFNATDETENDDQESTPQNPTSTEATNNVVSLEDFRKNRNNKN